MNFKRVHLLVIILHCTLLSLIILPSDIFSQWTYQYHLAALGPYPAVSVYAPNEVVVAGGGINTPKVYKSTNGGADWTDISGNLTGPKLFCVYAVNGELIFAADGGSLGGNGGNAKLWRTTNGGLNWSVVLSTGGQYGFFNGIVFSKSNPNFGIALSDAPTNAEFFVARTTNGGSSWEVQDSTPSGMGLYAVLGSVVCIDSLFYGWGIGPLNARVVFTTNGGASWTTRSLNLTGSSYAAGFAFNNEKTIGIAVGSQSLPNISRTTNGGISWAPLNTGLPMNDSYYSRIKWVQGTDICYITSVEGSQGCIGKSTNAGLNWTVMSTDGFEAVMAIDAINSGNENFGYAVTGYDFILRLQETVGIKQINNSIPDEFSLHQNYPNPFNPVTKIRFNVKAETVNSKREIRLTIFNSLGQKLETLVNEIMQPGVYEVEWDAKNYPSGVYFYTLQSEGFMETRKMIMNK